MPDLLRYFRALAGWTPRDAAEEIWRLCHLLRRPPCVPGEVSWRGKPLKFADGAAVYRQLREIFVAGVYDFSTSTAEPRLIEAGAHMGVAVLRWRQLHPRARITALGADPAIARILRENLTIWNDSATSVMASAAWTGNHVMLYAWQPGLSPPPAVNSDPACPT